MTVCTKSFRLKNGPCQANIAKTRTVSCVSGGLDQRGGSMDGKECLTKRLGNTVSYWDTLTHIKYPDKICCPFHA